ncbi:MAG: glycosyltransferase [Nanoarchaeota archaeon]|nr:glycosyltransferase [Nanoarchaeota archaeon]
MSGENLEVSEKSNNCVGKDTENCFYSIIIPAHNEEKYIIKTILSLLNQSNLNNNNLNFEIIVVANGCNDKTVDKVKETKQNFGINGMLKVLETDIANVSRARNIGAQEAKGRHLVFLDADTIPEHNFFVKTKNKIRLGHSVMATLVRPDIKGWKFSLVMGIKNILNYTKIYKGSSGLILCPADKFWQVGGFNENIIVKENKDLIRRLMNYGDYHCLNSYVTTSMRRYKEWGLLKAASFWLKQWGRYFTGDLEKSGYEKVR